MEKGPENLSGKGRKPKKVHGNSFRQRIAKTIRGRRLQLQLRAEVAADRVAAHLGKSVSVQTWYHWEKGNYPFDIDTFEAIAKALECAPQELLPNLKGENDE